MEANIQVVTKSRTPLTELLPVHTPTAEESESPHQQQGNETTFSLYDAPSLPGGTSEVGFLTYPSEGELTGDGEDTRDTPPLYAGIPHMTDLGTEGGDEFGYVPHQTDLADPSTSTSQALRAKLHELSGRSCALLKEYFKPSDSFPLPIGHPTVAFTETELYHLLKILTIKTMSLTHATMKKMVIDALKGNPTTKQSSTDHFRTRGRAQTPGQGRSSGNSFESASESDFPEQMVVELGHESVACCEESDGATEVALITALFNKGAETGPLV